MNIILFSEKDCFNSEDFSFKNSVKPEFVFFRNDERFLHIKKILKLSSGCNFKAGFINGKIGTAVINEFSNEKITFSFTETASPLPLPPVKLILGFPRPIQLKRILRDAASLGFSELFLTGTELGEKSYLKSNLSDKEKITEYLLDGISQAGQNLLPQFSFYNSVQEVLQKINEKQNASFLQNVQNGVSQALFLKEKKILLDISENAETLGSFKLKRGEHVIAAIGSERGWTERERELFRNEDFKTYSMGKRILRTETAVCAALSVIGSNCGFW